MATAGSDNGNGGDADDGGEDNVNGGDNDKENWVLKRNCFDNGGNGTLRLCSRN
jgi:hypothetical protein